MVSFNFSISTDTRTGQVFDRILHQEIIDGYDGYVKITVPLSSGINVNLPNLDDLIIFFDAPLSAPEIATLNQVVAQHPQSTQTAQDITGTEQPLPPNKENDAYQGFSVGDVWIDTVHNTVYVLVDDTPNAAIWNCLPTNNDLDGYEPEASLNKRVTDIQNTLDGYSSSGTGSFGAFSEIMDFGDKDEVADKFLKSSITHHTSLDSTSIALADGYIVHVSISTEKLPDTNWFLQIITNAKKDGAAEIQDIEFDFSPDAGNFKIDFDGYITSNIAFGATKDDVESALIALPNITDIDVDLLPSGNPGYQLKWKNAPHLGINQPEVIIDSNSLTSSGNSVVITVTTIQNGKGPAIFQGGSQIGTDLEKPSGQQDIFYRDLAGFRFLQNDRIAAYAKIGTKGSGTYVGNAIEPAVRLYIKYD